MTLRRLQTTGGQILQWPPVVRSRHSHRYANLPLFNHPVASSSAIVTPFEFLTFPLAPHASLPVFRIVPPSAAHATLAPYRLGFLCFLLFIPEFLRTGQNLLAKLAKSVGVWPARGQPGTLTPVSTWGGQDSEMAR